MSGNPDAVIAGHALREAVARKIASLADRVGGSGSGSDTLWAEFAVDADDILAIVAPAARAEERERCWREAQFVGSEFNMLWNDNVEPQLNLARREAAYVVRDRLKALLPTGAA